MEKNYDKILHRLLAYRLAVDMSQESMGKQFGITQSHYCKIESGNKIISFQSLKNFRENGGDIFYLLTGEHREHGQIDEYIARCKTKKGKVDLVAVILWGLKQGMELSKISENEIPLRIYKSMKLAEANLENPSIWKSIRKVENISQICLADKLDINIKRYRRIENSEVEPDAEILSTLYCELGYSPLIFFEPQLFYTSEANRIWKEITPEIRQMLMEIWEQVVDLINMKETV